MPPFWQPVLVSARPGGGRRSDHDRSSIRRAVTDAGRFFNYVVDNKMAVDEFLAYMKKSRAGPGHRPSGKEPA